MTTDELISDFIEYLNQQFPATIGHLPIWDKLQDISESAFDDGLKAVH